MTPVITLGIPDDLIRSIQIPPVDGRSARFILGGDGLFKYFPDRTGGGIGDTELFLLVVTGSADKRQLRSIFVPIHIVECPAAGNIIAEGSPVRIGWHLQH